MRKSHLAGVLVCFACLIAQAPAETVRWYLSFEYAKTVAKRTNRLMMVEIYAEGMQSSSRYTSETYTHPNIIRASTKFVPVRLAIDREGAEVAKKYKVRSASTVLFLTPEGRLVHRIVGYYDAYSMLPEMNKADGAARDKPGCVTRIARNPKDWEAAIRLAAIYSYELNIDKALAMLNSAEKLRPAKDHNYFSEAYNAIGDYYQIGRRQERAIPYFRKAAATAKRTTDQAYAYTSMGSCYLYMRDIEKARIELNKVAALPGVSGEDIAIAKQLLGYTMRATSAKGGRR